MPQRLRNPYWDTVKKHVSRTGTLYERGDLQCWQFCNKYAWTVTDPASLAFVASFLAPSAVEIGAGTGYWAWMMAQMGIDIVAYDSAPPNLIFNEWHSPWDGQAGCFTGQLRETYYPVVLGGPENLALHSDRTLLLSWPPYRSNMALKCLTYYAGDRLIYIGEGEGGDCATTAFFKHLNKNWRLVASHTPVYWYRSGDTITLYERMGGKTRS